VREKRNREQPLTVYWSNYQFQLELPEMTWNDPKLNPRWNRGYLYINTIYSARSSWNETISKIMVWTIFNFHVNHFI
jgi:hypothetical protein